MGVFAGPDVSESGLVLALDAGNQKSLNIPSQADHGYAEWYCMVSGGAVYSIINPTGGIIYENNAGTITALVTATGPQNGTISITAGRKYYGSVPINLVVEDQQHSIAPLTMVGTQFWNIAARASSPPTTIYYPTTYYVYSPYQTATVNFYDGSSTGLVGIATSTITVTAGSTGTFATSTETNHWISSDVPILASVTRVGVDKTILSPMSTYVYQRYQNYYNTTNNTTPTSLNSNVTYDSTYKVMNMNIADGSGGDCAQGLGLEYLADTYSWGNVVSDYVIVFPYTATVSTSYWNGSSWVVWETHSNISGSITSPGYVARDGTTGVGIAATIINGTAANMASGATLWKWEGTAPFYIVINDNADDEFAMLGWLSATKTTPRSGNIITDLSGNGKNGTLTNGPTYSSSNGGSIAFDGTNDYVSSGALSGSFSSFTVIIWFYPTSVTNYQNPIDCNYAYNGSTGNIGPRLEMTSGGALGWAYSNDTANNNNFYSHLVVSSGLAANTWHYAAITYNGATSTTYYNGNATGLSRTVVGTPTGFVGVMNNVTIGKGFHLGGAERIFAGRVSNTQIYNRALSATEIQQNFNALRGRFGI